MEEEKEEAIKVKKVEKKSSNKTVIIILGVIILFTVFVIAAKPSPNVMTGTGDSPDPQDIGSLITFVGTGTSTGGGSYSYNMYVCRTAIFLPGGTCDTGQELCVSVLTGDTNEATCDYTALSGDAGTSPNSYWINSRNTNGNNWVAEAEVGSQGTFSVNAGADTCSYTSGDWIVDCADDCIISGNVDVGANDIIITGTGTFTTTANITKSGNLYIEGTDSTNRCEVYCMEGGCFNS